MLWAGYVKWAVPWGRCIYHRQTAKAQHSLCICGVLLFAHWMNELRESFTTQHYCPFFMTQSNEPPHNKTSKMACGCPGWSESSLSARRKLGSLVTHSVHSEGWSDWVDAQADLSLCWAHMPFCWFCHEVAQMCIYYEFTGNSQTANQSRPIQLSSGVSTRDCVHQWGTRDFEPPT